MVSQSLARHILARYEPTQPLDLVVERLNHLYHEAEAYNYDSRHSEIFDALPQQWNELITCALRFVSSSSVRVLDFGCGTGFALSQLLADKRMSVLSATCVDISPMMLLRCKERFKNNGDYLYATHLCDVTHPAEGYDILLTNSLLHHLPNPISTVTQLSKYLAPGAVWISGHEPSRRFFLNSACVRHMQQYLLENQWKKYLSLPKLAVGLRRLFQLDRCPARRAAREAFSQGLFRRLPSARDVANIVDLHVPLSPADAASGRGFDLPQLTRALAPHFACVNAEFYNYMGPVAESRLSRRWRRRCRTLQEAHPKDGANFAAVWRKLGQS